jgi:hypothetical protein
MIDGVFRILSMVVQTFTAINADANESCQLTTDESFAAPSNAGRQTFPLQGTRLDARLRSSRMCLAVVRFVRRVPSPCR